MPHAEPDRLRDHWPRFLDGLRSPSGLALWVMIVVALLWLPISAELLQPTSLQGSEQRSLLADSPVDDFLFVTARGFELSRLPPRSDRVVMLGNSADLFAISSREDLAQAVRESGGGQPEVHLLQGRSLTLWEMRGLAEVADPGLSGVVLLSVGPMSLSVDEEELAGLARETRLGFDSETIEEEIRRAGFDSRRRWGVYFVDHHRFFLIRLPALVRNLLGGPLSQDRGALARSRPDELWQRVKAGQLERMAFFPEHYERNLAVLSRLVGQLSTARRVVLLEMTRNPLAEGRLYSPEIWSAYRDGLDRLAEETGVAYWDLNPEARLQAEDFLDFVHLGSRQASEHYTKVLGRRLARFQKESEP